MAELNPDPTLRPHRRWNPLRRDWVLVSPQRTARPWQGEVDTSLKVPGLVYDPTCYLCPGNARAGGQINPKYSGVFAFDNDYPALLPPVPGARGEANGLIVSEPESGRCRVVCFHPDHSLRLAQMKVPDIEKVVAQWVKETEELSADPSIAYVQIFENRGSMMGASNPHPHCQIWATGHVPDEPAAEGAAQAEYFGKHGRTLLGDYLRQELELGLRVVAENDSFVAVVPYWAVWPFETLILPRKQAGSFTDLTSAQTHGLADVLHRVTDRYDRIFDTMFPYTMGFHQRPVAHAGEEHPEWTFHAHFYPPLLRSAQIRKFMVGFEMLGMPQRDITPEKAAEMIRSACEVKR